MTMRPDLDEIEARASRMEASGGTAQNIIELRALCAYVRDLEAQLARYRALVRALATEVIS